MDRHLRTHSLITQTPPVHHHDTPAAVPTVFFAVSPLLKGVEVDSTKRTRLDYLCDSLGEGVEARERCCNNTKWDVSAVINMGFMSSWATAFSTVLQRLGVPIWTAA